MLGHPCFDGPLMRLKLLLLLCAPLAAVAATEPLPCGLELQPSLQQGQLVRGHVAPGALVRLEGHTLKVGAQGQLVFGLGREARSARVFVQTPAGCMGSARLQVAPREWQVEHVTGLPPTTVNPDPETARRIAAESARISTARAIDSEMMAWMEPMAWPARGRISGIYGSQRVLNGEPRNPHLGLDIAAPTGTPVTTAWPGKVTLVQPDMVLTGGTVLVDHGFGISTIYIHLSRVDVVPGQQLQAGERLGAIGATGRASGPHLHFQVHWFQEKLDPALLLPALK